MSIAAYKTWVPLELLTAADLNASFAQIINNPVDLWSPAGKDVDLGGFAITNVGNLTTTGSTALGNAAADTLSVSGSVIKNASGNWSLPAPSGGPTLALLGVAGAPPLVITSGGLATSSIGQFMVAGGLSTGRLTTDAGAQIAAAHSFLDSTVLELSAGSTATLKSGVVVRGGGATTLPNTVSLWTTDTKRWEVSAAGGLTGSVPVSGITLTLGQAPSTNATLQLNGGVSFGPYASLAASLVAAFEFATPISRYYIGDGTGYSYRFAKRTGSVTTDLFQITDDGRVSGTALHNNAGAVTGTTNQYIASGTYVPTVANVSNTSARSGINACWMRCGNVVTVGFGILVDPTAADTQTVVSITLPPTQSANFAANNEGYGSANCQFTGTDANAPTGAAITAQNATQTMTLSFTTGTDVSSQEWNGTFLYIVK